MLYDFDLLVPPGTLQTAPLIAKAHLIAGTLTQIRVLFPPGPATLVHAVIKDKSFQIMPVNPEGDINFDDAIVITDLEYVLKESPYELDMIGWSPLATFAHTLIFEFEVQPAPSDTWSTFIDQIAKSQRSHTRI